MKSILVFILCLFFSSPAFCMHRVDVTEWGATPQLEIHKITSTNPPVITCTNEASSGTQHNFKEGDSVYINGTTTQILNNYNFQSHAAWDVTGVADDSNGNCKFTFGNLPHETLGSLTQTIEKRKSVGNGNRTYILRYAITTEDAPDGNFTLQMSGFSEAPIQLNTVSGRFLTEFVSADLPSDFILIATGDSGPNGDTSFVIDNIELSCIDCIDANSDTPYTVTNVTSRTFELAGVDGTKWDEYDFVDRVGWIAKDSTSAVVAAAIEAKPGGLPLYFPPGTYRISPNGLQPIPVSIEGPYACLGMLHSGDGVLLPVLHGARKTDLRGLLGHSATSPRQSCDQISISGGFEGYGLDPDTSRGFNGRNIYNIRNIVGFDVGINWVGEKYAASSCTFNIQFLAYCNVGIRQRSPGIDRYGQRTENNRYYINYQVACGTHVELVTNGAYQSSNYFDWNVLEMHSFDSPDDSGNIFLYGWPDDQIGIRLDGATTTYNTFTCGGLMTLPENNGLLIKSTGAKVNRFNLSYFDFNLVEADERQIYDEAVKDRKYGRSIFYGRVSPETFKDVFFYTGSVCWNINATPLGWTCIASGKPGTWVVFGDNNKFDEMKKEVSDLRMRIIQLSNRLKLRIYPFYY